MLGKQLMNVASVAFLRLTWAVFLKFLLPIWHAAPNIQPKLQNHLGLFKNKQDNHKVCLYDKPAKHRTPAVPWLGTWQLQQEGSDIHPQLLPGVWSFKSAPLSSWQGRVQARREGSDLGAQHQPTSLWGQRSHKGAGCSFQILYLPPTY